MTKTAETAEIKSKMFNRSMLRFALPGPFDLVKLCLFVLMLCFPDISTSHCSSLAQEAQPKKRNVKYNEIIGLYINLSNPSDGCCKLSFQNELESIESNQFGASRSCNVPLFRKDGLTA